MPSPPLNDSFIGAFAQSQSTKASYKSFFVKSISVPTLKIGKLRHKEVQVKKLTQDHTPNQQEYTLSLPTWGSMKNSVLLCSE